MFRRSVSILVALGFLASQLASVIHGHGVGWRSGEHESSARAHFHLGNSGHSHRHHHSHTDALPGVLAPDPDHNDHAIYLPNGSALIGTAADEQGWGAVILPVAELSPAGWRPEHQQFAAAPFHPPDWLAPGGKLFLTLRTLRI